MESTRVYFASLMTEPEQIDLACGQVCVFSCRSPAKTTANEDAALVAWTKRDSVLLAVADGMGGEAQGDAAARLAVEALESQVSAIGDSEKLLRTAVIDGIESASSAVQQQLHGAGTTLAAVEIADGTVRPYHIGDSVVLVVGGRGKIKLQTVAHSPVGYGVESGLIDEGDAMHHDDRHVISNFIGAANMRIDIGSPLALARRDTVLLASDGLFDNLHVEEIVKILTTGNLLSAVTALVVAAQQRMGDSPPGVPSKPDDLTLVAFRLQSDRK